MTTKDWWLLAACRGTDTEMFYPPASQQPDRLVLLTCRGCPVRAECLEYAMESEAGRTESRHGVWGGLTPQQRRQLHRCRTGSCRHASPDACRQAAPWPEAVASC